jgi:choline kinase
VTDLLVLAAGLGKRFATMDAEMPKVLLELPSGRTLLSETLASAVSAGIMTHAVVVTGYRAELIREDVARHASAASITTVHNDAYATHGPVHSLWAAREAIERRDVVIVNGDTYYRSEAFRAVAGRPEPGFHLAYSRRALQHDDVKVTLGGDRVVAAGKRIPDAEAHGVSAGLFLVRGEEARAALSSVLASAVDEGRPASERPRIWHDLVNELASGGRRVFAVEVEHGDWREVDTAEDYAALCVALG